MDLYVVFVYKMLIINKLCYFLIFDRRPVLGRGVRFWDGRTY